VRALATADEHRDAHLRLEAGGRCGQTLALRRIPEPTLDSISLRSLYTNNFGPKRAIHT
jgi:hypothetical protein